MVSYSSKAGDEGCGVCVGEGVVSNGQGCYEQPPKQKEAVGFTEPLLPGILAKHGLRGRKVSRRGSQCRGLSGRGQELSGPAIQQW